MAEFMAYKVWKAPSNPQPTLKKDKHTTHNLNINENELSLKEIRKAIKKEKKNNSMGG